MFPFLYNLKIVLPVLLLLNTIGLYIFRKDLKFIKGAILLFTLLLFAFLIYRFIVSPLQIKNVKASRQAEIKKQGWDYINNPEVDAAFNKKEIAYSQNNFLLFRLVGLQAAFAFIFSSIGLFISADKKIYAVFALTFFILAYIFLT